jgi:tetratricopeptide (TPR) repeat protein
MQAGRWERAAELFRQGLAKDLSSSLNVRAAGMFAQSMGKLDVAERLLRHAVAIDPLCYQCLRILSQILMYRGKIDSALEIRSRYLAIGTGGQPDYSMMLILSGRPEKVAGLWAEAPDESYQKQAYLAFADHAMGDDDSVNTRLERMESQLAAMYEAGGSERDQANLPHNLALVYAWVGDADRAFELLIPLARQEGVESLKGSLFHPVWREIRDDPRWEEYRAALGMSEKRFAAIEFDPSLPE